MEYLLSWFKGTTITEEPESVRKLKRESLAPLFVDTEVRLVLIGKTGAGKSSAANTILGAEMCPPQCGMLSGTDKCDFKKNEIYGLNVQVTDTPGVCDTHRPKTEVQRELVKGILSVVPGPHAVLMCLRCDRRFTEEELRAYQELKKLFGDSLSKHMVLVFNGVDGAGSLDLEKVTSELPSLAEVVADLVSRDRHIALNNKADTMDRLRQGQDVLKLVSKVVKENEGGFFQNGMTEMAQQLLEEQEKETGKSKDEIKDDVIKENDPRFFGNLLNVVSIGLIPKDFCAVM